MGHDDQRYWRRKGAADLSEGWVEGPGRPDPPGAVAHLWRVPLDALGPRPPGLSIAERERASRLLRRDAAERWAASRWALRRVLGRYAGVPAAAIALELGENGKPRLADPAHGLEFNLSHSGGLALIAVSQRPVGVDVERIEPSRDLLGLAERALDPAALGRVRGADPTRRAAVFFTEWVRHEARLKCLGTGLSENGGASTDPVAVRTLEVDDGYAAAVALAGPEVGQPRRWTLSRG
jgi:4'-phosphopantetheinyl transferase